jgi:hypothetical protein
MYVFGDFANGAMGREIGLMEGQNIGLLMC